MGGLWFDFFFQAEDGIRDADVTGVQTCALPISGGTGAPRGAGGVLRSAAHRRPARAAGHPDPRRGRRLRADPDRRPDAARPAGAAAQRAAAALDTGALRLPAAPPSDPRPCLGAAGPGRSGRGPGAVCRLRGRRGDPARAGRAADGAAGADPTGRPIWRATTIRQLLTNPAYKGEAASRRLRTTPASAAGRRWRRSGGA